MRIECPLCKKVLLEVPSDFPTRPFCSPRCKLADLGNWLSERYVIAQPMSSSGAEEEDARG